MFFSYKQSCLWKFLLCFFPFCFGDSYFSIVEFLEIVLFLSCFSACFALWLLVLYLRKCQLLSPILLLKLFPLNLCCYIFIFQGNFVCFLKVGSFLSCIANDLKIFFFLFLAWSFSSEFPSFCFLCCLIFMLNGLHICDCPCPAFYF